MAKNSKTFEVFRKTDGGDLAKVGEGKGYSADAALINAAEDENSVLEEGVDYVVLGPSNLATKKIAIERKPKVTVVGSGRRGKRGPLSEEEKKARNEKAAATRAANKAKKAAEAAGETPAATPAEANPFAAEATPAAS